MFILPLYFSPRLAYTLGRFVGRETSLRRLAEAYPAVPTEFCVQGNPMAFQDKTIVCVDCNTDFVFAADEQQKFADRGFTNEPKRCKACREARKAQQGSGNRPQRASSGGGFGGGGGGGGGRGFGGGGRGFGGPKQMFPVTCAQCGQQTEVPFKPTGSRPVYCRECFQAQRAESGR